MPNKTETVDIHDDYLATLERVKVQYQQYVEVSDLYSLPTATTGTVDYAPPSMKRPLTTTVSQIEPGTK